MPITFHNADIKFSLKQKRELKEFIASQIIELSNYRIIELSFVFCSDDYLLDINKKFLNHDYYTDIITFPLVQTKEELEAEIYISIDRVKENAEKFETKPRKPTNSLKGEPPRIGTPFRGQGVELELRRVMFHGVLHLLGLKDKTKEQKMAMRKAEDKWLKKFEK